ncbi:MATE family efflux transporter [Cnuibacter sp. UC19_7]|uniref:MATE family efflux transporter n=1 Tax=Cnuibacter sp. UC19_7 TaxID=3350166 RepID=UPI00366DBE1B
MRELDRDILRLAVPALGALVAEPLFLLTDTALVGHLGVDPLAAVGVAGAVLQTVIGLLIFLAYATTPAVARRLGAGDRPGAVKAGIDGMWLALWVGVVLALVGWPLARPVVGLFGTTTPVEELAAQYLGLSLLGIPAMLLVIAATGLLRGLQDTRTPLVVAVAGFAVNAGLNALLIYGAGWGLAGSAVGTVLAQWGMAAVYAIIAVRAARRDGVSLRPGVDGVSGAAIAGGWLLLRTASLRAAILGTVAVAATLGVIELGAFQIAFTVFTTLALALDALAIAGQALIGHGLGASDVERVRAITRRLVGHGLVTGVVLGSLLALVAPFAGPVFTSDPDVRGALTVSLWILAISIPLGAYVFVLDGVLIGAGDARYLAVAGVINLIVYGPMLVAVALLHPEGDAGLIWLWVAFGFGYLGIRALTLGLRSRSDRWIVAGSTR